MLQKITLIVAIATLFTLGLLSLLSYVAWSWPLELLTHFRFQYLVLSLIVTSVLFILWRIRYTKSKLLIFTSLLLVGLNIIEILPWYLPHPQQLIGNPPYTSIRVLSFNINIQNKQYDSMVGVVLDYQPDVALLSEVSQDTMTKLNEGLKGTLPYTFRTPGGGLAIFSRFPLQDVKGDNFNKQSNHNLIATLEIDKQPVKIIGTHPLVPTKPANFHRRNRQLAALTEYIQGQNQPLILVGDFNLSPWSPYYRRFINKTKLRNARLGFGILPSWPRPATHVHLPKWQIPLVNIPIDHCLVSQHFRVARTYTGANGNSDHASLITELVLR
jgi:endonuclease/exonuclease/phosphatase (EEP) superfamily protein YafD